MSDVVLHLMTLVLLLVIIRLLLVIERTVRAPGGVLPPIQPLFTPRQREGVRFNGRKPDNDTSDLIDLDQLDPDARARAIDEFLKRGSK